MKYCTNCGTQSNGKKCAVCGSAAGATNYYCSWCGNLMDAQKKVCTVCKEPMPIKPLRAKLINLSCWILSAFLAIFGLAAVINGSIVSGLYFILIGVMQTPLFRNYILKLTHKEIENRRTVFVALGIITVVLILSAFLAI